MWKSLASGYGEANTDRRAAPLVSALRGIEVYLDRADNRVDALRQLFTPFVDKVGRHHCESIYLWRRNSVEWDVTDSEKG